MRFHEDRLSESNLFQKALVFVRRETIDQFLALPGDPIRNVMACIDKNGEGIALVVDESRTLVGTITDGDIRRAILDGVSLDATAGELLNRKVASAYPQPVTAQLDTDKAELLQIMQDRLIHQVPLLDESQRVAGLVTLSDLIPQKVLPVQAVIMAGGFGRRLRPLTEGVPKPMLRIGSRPLLERIIGQLKLAGVQRMNITTHYKPEIITEYFGNGEQFGVDIEYIGEESPMGTAGALGLIDTSGHPLLVINGDILTEVDFSAMVTYHREQAADMTIAVRQYDLEVPYGVLECDGSHVRRIREKPTYNFFVNAGIYLLQPAVHQFIPTGKRFDMTDLIERLIDEGRVVASFPVVEYWLDIGQHDDYTRAQEDLENGRIKH